MFGVDIKKGEIQDSQIMAIGSLLQLFFRKKKLSFIKYLQFKIKTPIIVYGSGFIDDISSSLFLLRRLEVRAIRGYHSLQKLKSFKNKNIKISKNLVVGDPGLLAKYLVDVSDIEKKYDLGIIPHFVDKDNLLLNKINVENSIVIDIQQEPEIFLKQIAQCRNVISSAMHGLIAADSLGIPNVRMVLSDKIIGGNYKYDDYYSAFGIKEHKIINLSEQTFTNNDLVDISKNYKIKTEQVEQICKNLIENFPYK